MAAVSSPSRSTTLNINAISSSPKLCFSQIPSSYTQICPIQGYGDPLIINTLMHTIKNICKIKDAQGRNYFLRGSDQECTVVMEAPGKREVTLLGCNFKLGVFFSYYTNEIPFYRMVSSFKQPLTEEQNRSITDKRCQYDLETRTRIANIIQEVLHFAPPRIVCDTLEKDTIQKPKTQIKWLPPSEAFTSDFPLKELVSKNQGLFFGHRHIDIDKIAALFKSTILSQLSHLEVQHLYLELPAARLHQQFALFNNHDPQQNTTKLLALQERLKACGVHKKILEICLVAKMLNIQVWPVDMSLDLSEITSLEIAIIQRNYVMLKNIRYYSSLLPEGKKYAGLLGAMHYQVGLDLDIPNVFISENLLQFENKPNADELQEMPQLQFKSESKLEKLHELEKKLYSQLPLEERLQFKNSPDVFLKILPNHKEFTLELHKKS